MKRLRSVIACMMIVCAMWTAYGGCAETAETKERTLSDKVSEMEHIEGEALVDLASTLWVERRQLGRTLIQKMNASSSKDVKACAAFLLGQYRIAEAVPHLARMITLRLPLIAQRERGWGDYPMVGALVEIGQPSVPYMVRNLEESDNEKVRELSLKVLRFVVGRDIAPFVVRRAMEQQEDTEKRSRLSSALRKLEATGLQRP